MMFIYKTNETFDTEFRK